MRSLARLLVQRGWILSGSDTRLSAGRTDFGLPAGNWLAGHRESHLLEKSELVIYSDAVPAANVERREAVRRGVPQISYARTLGHLMAGRPGLAVAGTHGKSTTTAMTAAILEAAGADAAVVFGANWPDGTSGGRWGAGPMLAEACEFRRNFLHLAPHWAAVLAIEADHFDTYPRLDLLHEAFVQFARRVAADGAVLVHETNRAIFDPRQIAAPLRWFGTSAACAWRAIPLDVAAGCWAFEIRRHGQRWLRVRLRVPGKHQVANALAAAALAGECGVSRQAVCEGLEHFAGLRRRLERRGHCGGAPVVDDYAHHPSEVRAALQALRAVYPGRRLWCVFQPHQALRLERLLNEFAASLRLADRVLVAEVDRARETQAPAVGAAELVAALRRRGSWAAAVADRSVAEDRLRAVAGGGEVFAILGAGNIGELADALVR